MFEVGEFIENTSKRPNVTTSQHTHNMILLGHISHDSTNHNLLSCVYNRYTHFNYVCCLLHCNCFL